MRIGCLDNVQGLNVSYKRRLNVPTAKFREHHINMEDTMIASAKCIGAIGITAAAIMVLKENKINLIKLVKEGFNKLSKNLSDKPPKSEIIKILDGKRDNEGVKLYNAFISKKKQNSLTDKILNGTLNVKSSKAYKYIAENSAELQRASNAI